MTQNPIDTTNVSFQCLSCKEKTTREFSVLEDTDGGPDLERLIEEASQVVVNCPNCEGGRCSSVSIALSNKIINHQGGCANE